MRSYRKRPVEVKAIQFIGGPENVAEILAEAGELAAYVTPNGVPAYMVIDHPREGKMIVDQGDWIVKNGRGEFYPCPQDTFARIYEPVVLA